MSPEAERVWNSSDQYVDMALQHLKFDGPYPDRSSDTSFDFNPELLRLNFLFPRIAEKGLNLLLNARLLRWRFLNDKAAEKDRPTAETALAIEHREAEWEGIKTEIENGMLQPTGGFSPVQKEIIAEKFIKL